ncbi:hypothetical protein UFOVP736_76 [uncultured Caudovirales phage]|uniref:Uncharacterized protein n=1 Tax=uncultured Caudovirales phage TaxID=2100421 RepID=A0A6J7X1X3_9CAUD|nr:hypothetical protein UFOVP705_5 [uncultured Caudovirales phage]CAB5224426.1 hypothetical protein UFOVP736_76 [uncultured Caudovirales phage]
MKTLFRALLAFFLAPAPPIPHTRATTREFKDRGFPPVHKNSRTKIRD